ncbi:MAG TPA: pyridoxal phosphate-dependent aminotransferase [Bryobacteraceae bacterium]|nr:pyridoxal phosphate-dependent aminotransferase [Bryobacteraceae bacterium]
MTNERMRTEVVRTHPRTALLKPTTINSILTEVRALQAQGRNIVSLMRGEPDFSTPGHIVEAATRALHSGRTAYPDNRGEPALREAIALKLSRDNGLSYSAGSEILVTDGATLGIHAALMTLAGPGDDVLLPDPIYDAYQSPIKLAGANACPVRSRCVQGRFAFGVEDLEAAWTPRSRVLLLNTPWNPVGTVFTRSELETIAGFVCRRNLTLISDEIYESITYEGHQHLSPAAVSPELRERCVLVNSLSKSYAMPGWRLGYCAAPQDILQSMLLVLQQSSRGPATFVQDAGVVALTGPQDCVEQMRAAYAGRRQAVTEALSGLAAIEVYPPEGGFFTIVDVRRSGRGSDDVRRLLLNEYGLAVVHGRAYGEAGEGMLRVSFASGGDTLARGLQLLRDGLASL